MIRWLLKSGFRRFGRRYNYDTGYMCRVADSSTAAALRLSLWPMVNQFRGPRAAQNLWAGAILGSTLEGDCGPCAQLVLDMAIEQGTPAEQLALCIQGKPDTAGDTGLGFRFARAAIGDDPELDALRDEIEQRFGAAAVTAASFAAATSRAYPVLKRGLGFGKTCHSLTLQGGTVKVQPVT